MAPKRKLRSSAEEGAGGGSGAAAVAGGAAEVKAEGAQQRAAKKSKPKKVHTAEQTTRIPVLKKRKKVTHAHDTIEVKNHRMICIYCVISSWNGMVAICHASVFENKSRWLNYCCCIHLFT